MVILPARTNKAVLGSLVGAETIEITAQISAAGCSVGTGARVIPALQRPPPLLLATGRLWIADRPTVQRAAPDRQRVVTPGACSTAHGARSAIPSGSVPKFPRIVTPKMGPCAAGNLRPGSTWVEENRCGQRARAPAPMAMGTNAPCPAGCLLPARRWGESARSGTPLIADTGVGGLRIVLRPFPFPDRTVMTAGSDIDISARGPMVSKTMPGRHDWHHGVSSMPYGPHFH